MRIQQACILVTASAIFSDYVWSAPSMKPPQGPTVENPDESRSGRWLRSHIEDIDGEERSGKWDGNFFKHAGESSSKFLKRQWRTPLSAQEAIKKADTLEKNEAPINYQAFLEKEFEKLELPLSEVFTSSAMESFARLGPGWDQRFKGKGEPDWVDFMLEKFTDPKVMKKAIESTTDDGVPQSLWRLREGLKAKHRLVKKKK